MKGAVDPLSTAIEAPGSEVMVDGLPRREFIGFQTPSAAAAHRRVEDGVREVAAFVGRWTSVGLG